MPRSHRKVLVLGGGVAGSALTFFLQRKGYAVTLIERKGREVGGLARTYSYAGHPYEFGPHVWFWPDPSPINDVVRELTEGELHPVRRRLYSYIERDGALYRYPIHYEDISRMPDREVAERELRRHRNADLELEGDQIPVIGHCTFEEYFTATVGRSLYEKFMKDYSEKMWNIPGEKLQTSMVWADRIKHNYSFDRKGTPGYDPVKFQDHTLGADLPFQVYPKAGWNRVWERMVAGAELVEDRVLRARQRDQSLLLESGACVSLRDFEAVISTLDIDQLLEPESPELPYTGRIMIPLLLPRDPDQTPAGPDAQGVFPGAAESLHYSGAEFQTRVTDMDVITRYQGPGRLILIEVPITSQIREGAFPANVMRNARARNLFARRAYPQQSSEARARYEELRKGSERCFPNLLHCGRHAEFRYIGMPETVDSAWRLVEERF